jgi:hypothetical protein
MSALAQRISETPMAPYTDILLSMNPQEMLIVVKFLQEAMAEVSPEPPEKLKKSNAEIIRDKYKDLKISQETNDLIEGLSLSKEEMNDERTRYILGY